MSYADVLQDFRRRKDEHFASGRGPVAEADLRAFTGLHYFEANERWQFQVPLRAPAQGASEQVTLQTNTGEPRAMTLLGQVEFGPEGQYHLSVFAPPGDPRPQRVFIPFRDHTSGQTTYGAGRYLDAPVDYSGPGTLVTLDFNMAYHPYCAYAPGWTCPLPPAGNTLPVAVDAGERLPEQQ